MRIYREPLFKNGTLFSLIVPQLFILLLLWILGFYAAYSILLLYLPLMTIILLLVTLIQFRYVIIDDDLLIVRSYLYKWRRKTYNLNEIKLVEIGNTGGLTSDYIRVFTDRKRSLRMGIALVGRKNCMKLVMDLEARGIAVEIKPKNLLTID